MRDQSTEPEPLIEPEPLDDPEPLTEPDAEPEPLAEPEPDPLMLPLASSDVIEALPLPSPLAEHAAIASASASAANVEVVAFMVEPPVLQTDEVPEGN